MTRCNISYLQSMFTLVCWRWYWPGKQIADIPTDQAPSAVLGRIRLHLPEQADYLLKGRVRVVKLVHLELILESLMLIIYSIWRPIVDVVEDQPLALCDARTVEPLDLVEADHVRKHYNGANIYAKPSPRYRWYYLNRQREDEVTLLKMFDNDPDVEATSKCKVLQ